MSTSLLVELGIVDPNWCQKIRECRQMSNKQSGLGLEHEGRVQWSLDD